MSDVVEINVTKKVVEFVTAGRGPIGPAGADGNNPRWGNIVGDIENQEDLNTELDKKALKNHISQKTETDSQSAANEYQVGDLFFLNRVLFRATRHIAVGDAITTKTTMTSMTKEFQRKANCDTIAHTEDTMTATQNYAVGDFISVAESLYRVTSAITSGDTIAEGTNVVATTIEAEVNDKVSLNYSNGYFNIG